MKKIYYYLSKKTMKFYLLMLVILFVGCVIRENYIFNRMKGTWEINIINYKNTDYRDSLFLNILFFENNKVPILTIPKTTQFNKIEASWSIETIDGKQYLEIEGENTVFNGLYELNFFDSRERGLLGVEMKSDSLIIIAHKFPR